MVSVGALYCSEFVEYTGQLAASLKFIYVEMRPVVVRNDADDGFVCGVPSLLSAQIPLAHKCSVLTSISGPSQHHSERDTLLDPRKMLHYPLPSHHSSVGHPR